MCGFSGFVTTKKIDVSYVLESMLDKIQHRGKDNRGVFFTTFDDSNIALGHNRLSVIDLSDSANQPFRFENYIIVYNGEVYNFESVKKELISKGFSFDTNSDTEVIIKAFKAYGKRCFSMLNGMFAIAIYDENTGSIILVRDRLGVKPLYYYKVKDTLLFSSELKSFHGFPKFFENLVVDKKMIANYFKYGYVNSFNSVFNNVHKLENGHIIEFKLISQEIIKSKFWKLENTEERIIKSLDKSVELLADIVKSSVHYRLVSDIPVGLFLSSGLDSNLVLGYSQSALKQMDTYTLKSEDYQNENDIPYDENVKRNYIESTIDDMWNDYKYLCTKYDEPFSDPATVGLYRLSKFASQHNKVIMVGDGGDELFAGYATYKKYAISMKRFRFKLLRHFYKIVAPLIQLFIKYNIEKRKIRRLINLHAMLKGNGYLDIQKQYDDQYDYFTKRIVNVVFAENTNELGGKNDLLTLLNYKTESQLIHQLNYKTDIAGMLNTVEIREPLLDYRLFEVQQRLSKDFFNEMVIKHDSKIIFRKIASKYLNIDLSKLQKKGFLIGLERVFVKNIDELSQIVMNHTSKNIDMEYVKHIFSKWKKGKIDFLIINRIISFILWEKSIWNDK